jgi:hypothetical protein
VSLKHKIAVAAAALVSLSGVAVAASPAQAAHTVHKTRPAVRTAIPGVQICDGEILSADQCMNRASGGTGSGTNVIAWTPNDNNNDFEFVQLTENCNHGVVSASEECPFTPGGGLNAAYDGSVIVEIEAYNENKCVADPNMTGTATLGTCPGQNGVGGSTGTVFVLTENNLTDPIWPTIVINRTWTDYTGPGGGDGTQERELAWPGHGARMVMNDDPLADPQQNFWENYFT